MHELRKTPNGNLVTVEIQINENYRVNFVHDEETSSDIIWKDRTNMATEMHNLA